MAESFGARASSPQVACLNGVRASDLVVLVLGHRYGAKQASNLSATHEEFREARGKKAILTFVQTGDAETDQAALIQEASGWEGGLFRESFSTPHELQDKVARAIHDFELAHAVAPVNPEELRQRAFALLPDIRRDTSNSVLSLAVAAGPAQAILRPAEMEAAALSNALQQRALFGPLPFFDRALGTHHALEKGALVIYQDGRQGRGASVALREAGDLLFQLPALSRERDMGFPTIIEEDIAAGLAAAIDFSAWLLNYVDSTERLTHVVLAARLAGGGFLGWRTRAEHAASPKSGNVSMFGRDDERDAPVLLTPAYQVRQALTMDATRLVEDLVVLLRRKWKQA